MTNPSAPDITRLRNLPSIRSLLNAHGITANKALGQNFLFDLSITDHIVRSAGNLTNAYVVEIGPGPGALTRSILEQPIAQLLAIETDPRFITLLNDYLVPASSHRLQILKQDALTFDVATLHAPVHIIANLPYHISTELLTRWFTKLAHIQSLTLMFQKEVGQRLLASPNSKAYGRLSVITQFLCTVTPVLDLPASAFFPAPNVDSMVVHLRPHPTPLDPNLNLALLEECVKRCFNHRRKTLRSNLKQLTPDASTLLEQIGIDANLRPENLSVADFCKMAHQFEHYLSPMK